MKQTFIATLVALLLSTMPAFAQEKETQQDKDIQTKVDVMPSFPGGESAMYKFISENLKYPVDAQKAGIEGRVNVRFVVAPSGKIEDVEIIRGIYPSCDKEVIRVVKAMPKWNPGSQKGEKVYVYFSLPVVFKL